MRRLLARHQPCGCQVCICDNWDDADPRCYGCGSKFCNSGAACVIRGSDAARQLRVYEDQGTVEPVSDRPLLLALLKAAREVESRKWLRILHTTDDTQDTDVAQLLDALDACAGIEVEETP